jgi:hypothetical protein
MNPPSDPLLKLILRQGSVFYIQDRHLTSAEPHYFVVLNLAPLADHCLLLAVSSSKIDNVRRRHAGLPPETLVEIAMADYAEFTKPSIIDCNTIIEKDHASLIQQLRNDHSINRADLPPAILDKLIAGVLASPLVTEEHKIRIRRAAKAATGPKHPQPDKGTHDATP